MMTTMCAILEQRIPDRIAQTVIYWDNNIDEAIICQGYGDEDPDVRDVIISIDAMPHIIRWMQSVLELAAIGEI